MKEAQLYIKVGDQKVHCRLCAQACIIREGKFGYCRVRQNIKGVLYTHNYGKLVAANVDPIEKKPLFHFLPGSKAFSIACAGCNFRCGFCQNWEISQADFIKEQPAEEVSPENIIRLAKQSAAESIAYTYTEPTIYFEFALAVMKLAKACGFNNIFVTNGYMDKEAVYLLKPYLDAVNVDLKFFKEDSYRKICSAKLGPVLDSIRLFQELGIWVEVTTLIIPGENDSEEELNAIAAFIAGLDKNIPWHVSRFHPDYEFDSYPSTPEKSLKMAYDLGKAQGLRYIYAGNISGWGQDTFCSKCQRLLIKREGYSVLESHLSGNRCLYCQETLPGIFINTRELTEKD
ncbi:MAG: AmmeMemoRadiSam system radical SAM enzyme [Candidatus Omnitrophica bacterium]|nr:AmmeMemoRadiSam system radical SAM enzyme [Candidatus Omnitrophota bacterium]